jgi:hypothetical protein
MYNTTRPLLKLSALLFLHVMLSFIAVVALAIFVKLRCVERSVFGPMVPDLGHLVSRAQGGTALYPQEPPVLEHLYR